LRILCVFYHSEKRKYCVSYVRTGETLFSPGGSWVHL
jgi:hypothetical protein